MPMEHLIFVFGTLKEGFPNFGVNRGTRISGEFKTRAAYPLYLVGERHSPWLIDTAHAGLHVTGQLFSVNDETLAAMDRLERVAEPDGYRRKLLLLEEAGSSNLVSANAYLKPPEQLLMSEVRVGPLGEYLHAHADLYRARAV